MNRELLWVSAFTPCINNCSAGSKTLDYYFSVFSKDQAFSISLLSIDWEGKTKVEGFDWSVYENCAHVSILYNNGNIVEKGINYLNRGNIFDPHVNLISPLIRKKIFFQLNKWKEDGYKPDVIILEWTNMVILAKEIKRIFPKAKLVASEHDVTYVGYKRKAEYYTGAKKFFWKIKYKKEKTAELNALNLCDLILPHNSENISLLTEDGIPKEKCQWLVPYFQDLSNISRNMVDQNRDVLFYGAMARPENYLSAKWFIDKVMPLLADLDIRFVILGGNPPETLKTCQIEKVVVTGFVEDITPYFAQSLCLVAPLVLGAGIKVKIIEGLSSGIPVVTNAVGII